jgi:hypothetical protein
VREGKTSSIPNGGEQGKAKICTATVGPADAQAVKHHHDRAMLELELLAVRGIKKKSSTHLERSRLCVPDF